MTRSNEITLGPAKRRTSPMFLARYDISRFNIWALVRLSPILYVHFFSLCKTCHQPRSKFLQASFGGPLAGPVPPVTVHLGAKPASGLHSFEVFGHGTLKYNCDSNNG
jgi:hypothetical protein